MAAGLDDHGAAAEPATPEEPPTRGRRLALALAAGVIALGLIAAGLAWAWDWRTHPDVFSTSEIAMTTPLETSPRAIYLAVTDPGHAKADEVTIESAEPRIVENTAEATFDFFI